MNVFEPSPAVPINTAEATQKLKEILNLGQVLTTGEEPMSFVNGSSEKTVSGSSTTSSDPCLDGVKMLDSLMAKARKQHLTFQGSCDCHSYDVYAQDVTVTSKPPNQITGNSRIRIKNVVDYGWESKYYYGKLIAVHISGTYIAYGGIIARDKSGIVRVINRSTGDRILLKGLTGFVKDLSFAYIQTEVLLAIVDEVGNLFIYSIKEEGGRMINTLVLHVAQEGNPRPSDFHRAIWCEYIPDESISEQETAVDDAKLLVVIHDNKAEMLNVDLVIKIHGVGPLLSSELTSGYQIIPEHLQPIVDAAFSPDGAALATASMDGEVKFFQVYVQSGNRDSSRCLHQWTPHDGKPVSCIFFLDNHRNRNPEVQFWKFAVTGSEHNTELKVWSCESWKCLQTIRFEAAQDDTLKPCFKVGLDLSSKYLLLSDINRKVLYVLLLYQDSEQKTASVSSISEFPLPFPMLNFTITDAGRKKYKQSVDAEHIEHFNAETDDNADEESSEDVELVEGVVISLFYIQPKSLQECRIVFQPQTSALLPACSMSTLSQDSLSTAFQDRLSEMSFSNSMGNDGDALETDDSASTLARTALTQSLPSSGGQILLTPDAFTSPNHSSCSNSLIQASVFNTTPTSIPLPPVTPSEEMVLTAVAAANSAEKGQEHEHRQSGRSSGSSPSLEVQQILAPRRVSASDSDDKKGRESQGRASETGSIIYNSEVPVQSNGMQKDLRHSEDLMKLSPITMPKMMNPEYDVTIWPLAPNLNSDLKVISNESLKERVDQQQQQQLQDQSYNLGGGDSLIKSPIPKIDTRELETKLDNAVECFEGNQKALSDCVQSLKSEIHDLREEVRKQSGITSVVQNMCQYFEKREDAMATMVDRKLVQLKQADNKHLESVLMNLEEKERQRHERLMNTLTQTLSTTLSNRVDNVVKNEIRSVVPSMLGSMFETLKQQVHIELSQKFSDNALKDSIGKLLKNKGTVETIGGATAAALHGYIQSSYKDTFQSMVIPAFDKACHNVFQQVNESFQQGAKEYSQSLENYLEGKRRHADQNNEVLLHQIQENVGKFNTNTERLSGSVAAKVHEEMAQQLQTNLASMQEILMKRIQQSVKEEINTAMKDQKSVIGDSVMQAIRSGAVTPIPSSVDTQARVAQLIRQGYLNAAFQQALSASDLSLVSFVCEALPTSQVFGKVPCQLEQPVLLSLIQQLSADLSLQTDLKLNYLQEAIVSLDHNNPKEHLDIAIGVMQKKLQQFMKNNPSSEYSRRMKMLLMTSQSLLHE